MAAIPDPDAAPFGAHALPPLLERLRRASERAPRRWIASAIRRLVLRLRPGPDDAPVDVPVFARQRMRLHPTDNRTEKRALAGVRFWDAAERGHLAHALREGAGTFHFLDAGANVGLYTLWLRDEAARCGRPVRQLAVECDPVNGARLAFNLAASGASEVQVAAVALSAKEGELAFRSAGLGNRGEARVAPADGPGTIRVPALPLLEVLRAAGFDRLDAMKMDIEGHEPPVLAAFFAAAPRRLWPRLCVMETGRAGVGDDGVAGLMVAQGYVVAARCGINGVFVLPTEASGPAARDGTVDVGPGNLGAEDENGQA